MKLRGRIAVAFCTVIMIPLLMITAVTFFVFQTQFDSMEQSFKIDEDTFAAVINPILLVNRITRNVYNEVKLCGLKTPERLENQRYVESLNNKIKGKYSFLVLRRNEKITYSGSEDLTPDLIERLPSYGELSTEVDGGTYLGGMSPMLIKQTDFLYPDSSEGSAFVITNVSRVLEDLRKSLSQIVLSIVAIMFLTGAFVTYWLYRSVLHPLRVLQNSTNRMKEGDLNVSVQPMYADEIGELCEDFEEMRLHMKGLLEENMQHERESKELISNISHDLKTPITAIKGYAEGLFDGVADTPQKQEKYLRTIYTKASDMSTLVDELSMYAKIDTNSVPYNFQSLNLNSYLEDSIAESRLDLELQNMDLAYFPYLDKTQEVIVDPEQLKRVINNILSNAVKYREPSRKGIICIRTADVDENYVQIELEDNGKGIGAKELPNIFERFYRTDASRNSSTGGSGLGLAISKKIIEDHGGRIWAESRAGVGTTIFILLRKVVLQQAKLVDKPLTLEASKEKEKLSLNGIVAKWNEKRRGNHE